MLGTGVTVTLKSCGNPLQVPMLGTTVMVPVCTLPTGADEVLISPEAAAGRPMAVLELVQLNVALAGVALKVTTKGAPPQRFRFGGSTRVGVGVTVTWMG